MKFNRTSSLSILSVLATAIATWSGSAAQELREEFHQTYPLAGQRRVSLDNLNGNVRVVTWDRDEIRVDAVKHATKQQHLDLVKIEVAAKPDRIRIKSKYSDSKSRSDLNNSTSVDYTLTVPTQSRLDKISTVNGGVEIENVKGDVEAESVNGPVTASGLAGAVELSTVNGSLKAGFTELKKPVSLKSVNGSITATVPTNACARVSADTLTGSIENDFSLPAKKHFPVGRTLDGKLGEGGSKLKMSTVNGAIHLDRAQTVALSDR